MRTAQDCYMLSRTNAGSNSNHLTNHNRRTRHVAHLYKSNNEFIDYVLLWAHRRSSVKQAAKTFIHQICIDWIQPKYEPIPIEDRDEWQN